MVAWPPVALFLLSFTISPLEIVPFASSALTLVMAALGFALLVKDELLMPVTSMMSFAALRISIGLASSSGLFGPTGWASFGDA